MKQFALIFVFLSIACRTNKPVTQPIAFRPIAIRTCVAGATIRLDGAGTDGTPAQVADANGDTTFAAIAAEVTAFNLHVTAPGYPEYGQVVVLPPGTHQFLLGACVPLTDAGVQVQLPLWRSLYADTGERGAVHIEGTRFVRDDGSTFPWRGTDGFLLYQHWLSDRTSIDPIVQDWLTCGGGCVGKGPNLVRVFGMVTWGPLYPQDHPEYYEQLRPFVDHLWTTFHLRVEFVVFADAQPDAGRAGARAQAGIMPDRQAEIQHAMRVHSALATADNVFIEVSNEPFKNLPGGGARAYEIGRLLPRLRGLPIASGDYDEPWNTALDYITVHTDRGYEWPRKAKDLLDIRNGDLGDPSPAPGWQANRPVVGDEPIGFAEVAKPGSRSASADDAAHFAAACQMFAAGCTFHSDTGTDHYGVFPPGQAAASAAFFQALHFVPPDAQFAPYTRGTDHPGCNWTGEAFVEHEDALELRSFGKRVGNEAWVVQIRTKRPHVIPCAGWHVVEELRPGLVKLAQ